ncbi:unnamed protein product [Paramecium pentaurelia]|uniref:UBR-type domain-containing protein n=1 Tax=Paramecium pentaurelia TaxID=43138 RepID=A0A8S1TG20_9CILI|nr:unnamed protein product [Paramecium pentaurelia]
MKSLIEKLDQRCNHYDKDLEDQDIFAIFISNQQSHLNFIQQTKVPKFQCQNTIEKGEIVFQCFTCSKNIQNMICQECFDFEKHKGHQFFPTTIQGICDCGNTDIFKECLCSIHNQKHQSEINQNQKIPQDLCQNIEQFIRAFAILFEQYSIQISKQIHQFPTTLLVLYDFSLNQNLSKLEKLIVSKFQISNYYELICKTRFLFEIFYLGIDFIIDNNPTLQNFVSYLFQLPFQQNPQYSILESILQNYGFIEPLLEYFELNFNLSGLILKLFKNQFKQSFIQLCFKKFQSFTSYVKIIVTPNSDIIQHSIKQIENLMGDEEYISDNDGIVQGLIKQTEQYFQALQTSKLVNVDVNNCELLEYLSSIQDISILNEYVFGNYTYELFKMIQKQYQYLHTPNEQWMNPPTQPLEFMDTQLQQKELGELCMIQFQQILGKDFNLFMNQNVNKKILKNYQMNDHIITTLINSLSEAFPSVYQSYKGDYSFRVIDKENMLVYIDFQGYALDIINLTIQNFFSSKLSTKQFQTNFINLLIVKCYNFIKLKRNIFPSLDQEIKQFYDQQLNKMNQTNDQKSFLLKSMCIHLFKNASLLDKMFIIFLYVHFCQKEYKNPADFRSYLSDLLEEPIEIIKNNLQKILQRCIQTFTTIYYTEDPDVIQDYFGISSTKICFKSESIDTAFGKLYLFLFDSIGLSDIYQAFQVIQVPTIGQTCEITYEYFMRMMTSDLDVFNICITYFEKDDNLPNILQQALQKLIQNILASSSYYLYSTIMIKFQTMGISISSNLEKHILKFCYFDTSVNKLTLKKEYKQIYDPNLFILDQELRQLLLQLLQSKLMTQRVLTFGNGLEYDIQQFNQPDYHYLRKNILQVMCSIPSIFQSFNLISQGFIQTQIFIQFIYYQLICANYFYKNDLQIQTQNILNQLQNLRDNQKLQEYQVDFELLILLMQKQSFNGDIPNLSPSNIFLQKAKASKSHYRLKYDKMKSSKFIQNLMNQHLLNDVKQQKCDFCQLELQSNKVMLIFLSNRIPANNYSIIPQIIEQASNNSIYSPAISIENCIHKYHDNCFQQFFGDLFQKKSSNLPEWQKYNCPICLKCFNIQMPMDENMNNQQLQSFNQYLLQVVKQLHKNQAIYQQYQNNELLILVEIYLELIINLIQNLFINVKEFQQLDQHLILKQLINFLSLTIENYKICGWTHNLNYNFQSGKSILIFLLNAIDKHIIKAQNSDILKAEILKLATKFYHNYSQEMEILCQCFGIQLNLKEESKKNKDYQLQLKDEFAEYYMKLQIHIRNQIINILGQNFQQFHDKYFSKLCHYCKSYNKQFSKSEDILVCILCSKVFCLKNCSNQGYGNLNMHAQQEHDSQSIYVSLINGKLTYVSVPHSNYSQRILYINQRHGNPIRNESYNLLNENWKDFVIDQNKVKEIADIIIKNTLQIGFTMLQTNISYFHYSGEL